MKNIIVGQSGGPTAVINSSLLGVYKTAKDRGADKVYGMVHGIKGLLDRNIVDLSTCFKTNLDTDLLKRTPSSFLGSCRYKLPDIEGNEDTYEKIFKILNELDICAFFYIGGNDSMDTITKLSDYGIQIKSHIRFIGVPKTIDNDLAITDHTPGYGSAAKYIAATTKEIIRDGRVYDYPVVSVIEVMGRNAGWLTAAAALSEGEDCEGVDAIYLPEIVFDVDKFLENVGNLLKKDRSIVIAVSEGVKVADGRYVCELADHVDYVDAFGHKQLAGTARYLASKIDEKYGIKTRAIELSSLQRCASHIMSRVDMTEAFNAGGAAVKAAFEGLTGHVITLKRVSDDPYMCITEPADVHFVANVEKKVPLEWITDDGANVKPELVHYIMPLIQAEIAPLWINGLPRHIRLMTKSTIK
ncbi:MAG: 6-phosphofructokinase [Clostridiales bacterium]|nr:6-phosphofructokinase [Clostridiales bacterium]